MPRKEPKPRTERRARYKPETERTPIVTAWRLEGGGYDTAYQGIVDRSLSKKSPRETMRKAIGGYMSIIDLLDRYYESTKQRNTAIALVSPTMTDEQIENYQQFVDKRQEQMLVSARKCIDLYFDLAYEPLERASFVTGMIMDTEKMENDAFSDLIDYRDIRGNTTSLVLSRALSNRIKRIAHNGGDDGDIRNGVFSLYSSRFDEGYVSMIQEHIVEAKTQ